VGDTIKGGKPLEQINGAWFTMTEENVNLEQHVSTNMEKVRQMQKNVST